MDNSSINLESLTLVTEFTLGFKYFENEDKIVPTIAEMTIPRKQRIQFIKKKHRDHANNMEVIQIARGNNTITRPGTVNRVR